MTNGICDVCGTRPANVRARAIVNGKQRNLELCDEDYRRMLREQKRTSPLESLFGNSGFGSLFDDDFFGIGGRNGSHQQSEQSVRQPEPSKAVDIGEYLSDRAKDSLQNAARFAQERGRREVDTEHLLYTLADTDVVQAVLEYFKLEPSVLRQHINDNTPKTEGGGDENRETGVTPRLKDALTRAISASRELGHNYVGPEHLLIGLAEEGEGLAADVLQQYGLTPQAIRQQVIRIVGEGAEVGEVERPSNTPNLDKYSRNLTQLARDGKLDPVIGRAKEIETTIEVLARRKKNNPVLIGEPGVGKTAIAEGLAQRMVSGEVPEAIANKRLIELNINSLIAGSKYRGEFEERVQQLLEEIKAASDTMILFIDEVHTMVGAGAQEGGMDVANTFKPAMARGELNLIGATTLNEYQKYIEKDAALERRFQPVMVAEPTIEQTVMILRGMRDTFETHHKVAISDKAIVAAAELSERYITNRFLPDKALDLIDQAAARVRMSSTSRPPEVLELEAEARQLKREQDYASSRKKFEDASNIEKKIAEVDTKAKQLEADWRRQRGSSSEEVTFEDVAQIVSKITGVPVTELTTEERGRLLKLEDALHERVVGQNEAVVAVSNAVRLARAGLREGSSPIATFFFLGPTGVGKTELAKALAETVFGDEGAMIRIDMSEYMEKHAVARLIGAPPGYVGYDEGGQLTEQVRRKPYSVILLDEIEKAHGDVSNILLQVFDDGRLTDGKGRVIDFTNTIIIATSNLGANLIQAELDTDGLTQADHKRLRGSLMDVLRGHFRPEFINRIDEVIIFDSLAREDIKRIVEIQLERVKHMALGQGIKLEIEENLLEHLADAGFRPEYGARELRRLIRSELETTLANEMLSGEIKDGDTAVAAWDGKEHKVIVEKRAAKARKKTTPKRKRKPSPPKKKSSGADEKEV
jgi:ATP-dependent Clp protease ATP-binding subunit ClpC